MEVYVETIGKHGEWHTLGNDPFGETIEEAIDALLYDSNVAGFVVDLAHMTINGTPFRFTDDDGPIVI